MSTLRARLRGVLSGPRLALLGVMLAATVTVATLTRAGLMVTAGGAGRLPSSNYAAVFGCGLLYDLAFGAFLLAPAVVLLLAPGRWWSTRLLRWLVHAVLLALFLLLGFIAEAEFIFFDEFSTRFNFIAVDYLVYTGEVLGNIWESYRVVWLLVADCALAAIAYWFLRPRIEALLARPSSARPWLAVALWGVVAAFAGLLDQRPRETFANPYASEFASNGPYQFFAAFRNNELDYERFYPTLPLAEVDRRLRDTLAAPGTRFLSDTPLDIRREVDNPGAPRRLNVVLIMVESLGADFMGHFGDARGMTPHLDDLAARSLVFENFYAAGTRTVRGLEAVTLSLPPTPGQAIVKRLGRESGMWSLGRVLDAAGYDSTFVYGGRAYFDNMGAFFAGNGYAVVDQRSTPAAEIGFTNAWGMSDEDLYRQALAVAARGHASGRPFFMHIMTTSNHRPYTYPEGRVPGPQGGRANAVRYTDWALDNFLARARAQPWFDDTVFVILGDHCANAAGKVDLPASRYHVPLLIYSPRHVTGGRVETLASQVDVAPTLLGLLRLDYQSAFLGRDILAAAQPAPRALISTYQDLGLIEDGVVTVLAPQRRIDRHRAGRSLLRGYDGRPGLNDELVREAVALYQGASYIYSHGLNAWQPLAGGDSVAAAVAPP
ncbi:MAG: LTA synthase family protein [Gammaproteobacteria bacterium]